jgi:predicted transcriptional regulator of viral defense system
MADSGYISANLTPKQLTFIRLMDDFEIDIFSLSQIESQLSTSFENLNEILENLVDKKILVRIERGKYCRANFKNEKVIGCFVSDGSVAYWSALNAHGLTEQFPNIVYIQTTRPKRNKTILGVAYKFVKIAPYKMAGINSEGQGNLKYRITDLEKTLVDCFDLPEHSGGYPELIRAFSQANLDGEKMIAYSKAIGNIAATKRMGFLAELFDKKGAKAFVKYARQQVNDKYNVFDPYDINKGEFVNDWRLRLNISRQDILNLGENLS